MASSWRTKIRIAAHVLLAPGFLDAIRGRFLMRCGKPSDSAESLPASRWCDARGAVHVHTCTYSDGLGTVEDVLSAAADVGLDYVFLADHNTVGAACDGWPERTAGAPPHLIVGNEITVRGGRFLLALGLPPDFDCPAGLAAQEAIDRVLA
ncbi:MAG: PHP domain-containing protein, partial [Armatimonadota bacterium]